MDKKSKNIIAVLCGIVVALVLAIVGIVAFNFGKDKGREEVNEKNVAIISDTVKTTGSNALATTSTQETPAASPKAHVETTHEPRVWGDLYGNVGGQYLSIFEINKSGSGYYETGGARRTLKVVSRGNGHMVVKAYLRGKYIGEFKGRYSAWGDRLTLYEGTFYSSRGGGLKFDLINPLD